MELYTYFRSSASYRVRIALALKGMQAQHHYVHLLKGGGEQHQQDCRRLNASGLVPVMRDGDDVHTQSLAMLEYLEERHPDIPLLPTGAADRSWVRSLSLQIACEIHPLNNLRVLQYLKRELHMTPTQKQAWITHWVTLGFAALETQLATDARTGTCCFGNTPTIADCCLVPQTFNARRFGVPMEAYPTLARIEHHLQSLEPFRIAAPAAQADAE